ncbi:D-aminoacylase [Nocardioides ginsengisoli]|uniref:Amidohydrolase family protein n=1 Tax=Nocardioides ginsengisoli TaxID=363868 RepID=A0ABW3W597_9ACTN
MELGIFGGTVADGGTQRPQRADVLVDEGRIVAVGSFSHVETRRRLDATDAVVLPGFIDTHIHLDGWLAEGGTHEPTLRQGVTTAIVGQDGTSHFLGGPETVSEIGRYFAPINGPADFERRWTVAEYLDAVDQRSTLNVAALVPHGNARHMVLGSRTTPATAEERARIRGHVAEALEEGAVGVSTGLHYVPSRLADREELLAVSLEAAAADVPHVTHMRGYGDQAATALEEMVDLAAASKAAFHISHLLAPPGVLARFDDARQAGLDLTYDAYPYDAGFSVLTMFGLPEWAQEGDRRDILTRLSSPDARRRIDDWARQDGGRLRHLRLAHLGSPALAAYEGLTLERAAYRRQSTIGLTVCDLLLETDLDASAIGPNGRTADELIALSSHPGYMAGSDGIYIGGSPHPRGWGAFARTIKMMVHDARRWDWSDVAHHLAAAPARRFGLSDRGELRPGLAADVVVMQPEDVADRATYDDPTDLAAGARHVVVNGVPALVDGQVTGATPGRALRRLR